MAKAAVTADEAVELLSSIVMDPRWSEDALADVPEDTDLGRLCRTLAEIRAHVQALSQGDLSRGNRARGFVAGSLKATEANLRHLTWQMEQVAKGDYSQSVSFMGEFSDAFNRMSREMGEKVREVARLFERYKLSTNDLLTGLMNRKAFCDMAISELWRAKRLSDPLCLVLGDIDDFGLINDRFGHATGDSILRLFACRLKEALRPGDVSCRFGGDEFLVLMPRTSLEEASACADHIRRACAQPPLPEGALSELSVTASFGVAFIGGGVLVSTGNAMSLLERAVQHAERNLAKARLEGGNRVCCEPPNEEKGKEKEEEGEKGMPPAAGGAAPPQTPA